MRSVNLSLVAAALFLGTTALTTPAFATGNHNNNDNDGDVNVCTDNSCKASVGNVTGGSVGNITNTANGGTGGAGGAGGAGGHGYGGAGGNATGGAGGNATGGAGGNATNSNKNEANNTNINAPIAHGGEGGEGGKGYGGNATGGNATGGAANANNNGNGNGNGNGNLKDVGNVSHSGNSYNKIDNTDYNKNEQDQDQKQKQQQQQKQSQEIKNSGNSEIKNSGNSYSKNENDNSNSNNASQETNVNTYNERAPVNTAYAAPLAVGEDTCMGSSSIGAQAVSFGLSIGTTWQDDNCRRLKNSRQMVSLGYHRAATALMCVDADVEAAMTRAGTPCPNGAAVVAAAPVYYQEAAPAREYTPMAPVVDAPAKKKRRARKALPPK